MAAAEKLRALEANAGGFHDPLVIERLRSALPQIIAVVKQVRCKRDPWGYSRCAVVATPEQMCEACAALAALDEALP